MAYAFGAAIVAAPEVECGCLVKSAATLALAVKDKRGSCHGAEERHPNKRHSDRTVIPGSGGDRRVAGGIANIQILYRFVAVHYQNTGLIEAGLSREIVGINSGKVTAGGGIFITRRLGNG